MNGVRRIIGLVMAVAIAVFASPGFADNDKKIYNLQMQMVSVPPAQANPPFTLRAVLTNEPTGNSTINSFRLSVSSGLTIVGVDQPASGHATFTASTVTVVNASPIKPGKSLSVTLRVSSCGDSAWSSTAWTGSSLNGQSFDLVVGHSALGTSIPCGDLARGDEFTVPDSLNPDCITGHRGYYDKDGSIPTDVLPYFVTNLLPNNGPLHFRWPELIAQNGDPKAAFDYTVCAPGTVTEDQFPDTQVAWLNTDGSPASTPGTPAFIDALDCFDPKRLPAPYGTLLAALGPNDTTTIAIDTTNPPRESPLGTPPGSIAYPGSTPSDPSTPGTKFDIVIETERITVQLVCLDNDSDSTDPADCTETEEGEGEALMVVERGVGGTTAASHAPGFLVMSTPLPLLPESTPLPYHAGRPAQMCIADQGNEEGGHFTTFIDIGDGYVKLP